MPRRLGIDSWLQGRRIHQPSLFLIGEHDPVRQFVGQYEAQFSEWLSDLRGLIEIPGAGHWIQQERADEVNRALIDFLRQL